MNPLPVGYRKIRRVVHQLYNGKVNEKHLLIMVNSFFSLKRSVLKWKYCICVRWMLLCYFTLLTIEPNIHILCTAVYRERYSVYRVDHCVHKSGHL